MNVSIFYRNTQGQNDDNEDMPSKAATSSSDQHNFNSSTQLNFSEILKIGMKSREILPKAIMDEM